MRYVATAAPALRPSRALLSPRIPKDAVQSAKGPRKTPGPRKMSKESDRPPEPSTVRRSVRNRDCRRLDSDVLPPETASRRPRPGSRQPDAGFVAVKEQSRGRPPGSGFADQGREPRFERGIRRRTARCLHSEPHRGPCARLSLPFRHEAAAHLPRAHQARSRDRRECPRTLPARPRPGSGIHRYPPPLAVPP